VKRLGIKTLAEFHGISRSSIASRFGKEGLVAAQYIETAKHIPWPRFYPIEKIIEQDEIDESYQVKELEPLLFILRKQIDKALLRLRGSGKLASEVQIRMRLEKLSMVQNTLREWKIELSFPQGSVIGLLPIIKERLDRTLQREPLESAVCYLEFEIVRSVYGSAKQKDFLSQKEEEKEAFQTIVARLTEKLGIEKAFFAKPEESYFPEKSWTKSLLEPHDIQLPFSDRPLRMKVDIQTKSFRWGKSNYVLQVSQKLLVAPIGIRVERWKSPKAKLTMTISVQPNKNSNWILTKRAIPSFLKQFASILKRNSQNC
jgi:hypothetical protein